MHSEHKKQSRLKYWEAIGYLSKSYNVLITIMVAAMMIATHIIRHIIKYTRLVIKALTIALNHVLVLYTR